MTNFARPHYHLRKVGRHAQGSYTPAQVMQRYGLPKALVPLTVAPVAIGLPELAGGYLSADVQAAAKLSGLPIPIMSSISVQGAVNSPGDAADGEVALDIQIAAMVYSWLTGQAAYILPVFAPNTSGGYLGCWSPAVAKWMDVWSTSWGSPEDQWGAAGVQAMEAVIGVQKAAGKPTTAAAGDNGSGDGERGDHADCPASCPSVLGCGGTMLTASSETVWNGGARGGATGGGYSSIFGRPAYQLDKVPDGARRGVPDVAGVADPATGWQIVLNGQVQVIGGTSAVAPMWAGIIAAAIAVRRAKGLPPLGDLHALLYAHPEAMFDVVTGNNGDFRAGPGWDATTGLGTPTARTWDLLTGGTPTAPPVPVPVPPSPSLTITLAQPLAAGVYTLAKAG